MQNWNIQEGWDVYDYNDDKIGTVKSVMGGFFQIDTGFLGLGKDYYIPFSAIRNVSDGKLYISESKDQLDRMGWDRKPTGGISGTSPSDRL